MFKSLSVRQGKYVSGLIRERPGHTLNEAALVFAKEITHADVGRVFTEVHGAGFYSLSQDETGEVLVHIAGRSESLDVDPKPGDAVLVKKALSLI